MQMELNCNFMYIQQINNDDKEKRKQGKGLFCFFAVITYKFYT